MTRRRWSIKALGGIVLLAMLAVACGDDDESTSDVSGRLTRAGTVTRAEGQISFVQVLRAETSSGEFVEQTTEGIYDGDAGQASLVVTTERSAGSDSIFVVDSTVEPGTTLRLVMDNGQVFLRVDVLGLDSTSWSLVPAGESTPTADSTVAVLGSALVADVSDGEQIGETGAETVGGVAVTRYRVPADAANVAIYLPTETLNVLAELGFRSRNLEAATTVDYWLDDADRIRRVEIDHQPLLTELVSGAFDPGVEIIAFTHSFEITQFGDVSVVVPGPAEIAAGG